MQLVIMAAGEGRRFGGLKQIEKIDERGNFIADYLIFDALRCGVDGVVFVIREEILPVFKRTIFRRVGKAVNIRYVFQDNKLNGVCAPKERTKPFGTSHALLCATREFDDDFLVVNADDFYGFDAIRAGAEFLKNSHDENQHALVGFGAGNTMTENGDVRRGVCEIENGRLVGVEENVLRKDERGNIWAVPIEAPEQTPRRLEKDAVVSMNMFAFKKSFAEVLQSSFDEFLRENKDNLLTAENMLPKTVSQMIERGKGSVLVCHTNARWHGMTYLQDKPILEKYIKKLIKKGEYPLNLFN